MGLVGANGFSEGSDLDKVAFHGSCEALSAANGSRDRSVWMFVAH
jgi:hypothetical protein